ncbi:MAG: hypothetical protein GF405_07850 [Candidatus Eisenbacteria bacterium]|nr:hypothetical protein [Candidatus Eisenbacteria bacterium]
MRGSTRTLVAGRTDIRALIMWTAAALALVALLWPVDARGGGYPRLANIYFGSLATTDLEKLARWDVLVLGKRAEDLHREEVAELRQLNPDITILAHMAVSYHGGYEEPPINGELLAKIEAEDWWLRDTAGSGIRPGFPATVLNLTTWCQPDSDGKMLCEWLPEYINEKLGPGGIWDGVYLDCCWERVAWVNGAIDANGNGLPDDADELNENWREGLGIAVARLRELVGRDYAIVTNGNNTLYDHCNGGTRENFPEMHGGWLDNVLHAEHGYRALDARYRDPAINIINSIWEGAATASGPVSSSRAEKELRLGLTSTLVFGDGYFSFDGGDGLPCHSQLWWHELYDIELGEPLGRAVPVSAYPGDAGWLDLGDMLRLRRFEKGVAVVNPSMSSQTIDLGGFYFDRESWNGEFYPQSGVMQHVTVDAVSGEILVGRGRLLVGVADVTYSVPERGGIALDWEEVPGATGYSVYRENYRGPGYSSRQLLGVVATTSYTDGRAKADGNYRYYVAPIDEFRCEGRLSRPIEVTAAMGSDLSILLMVDEPDGLLALTWTVPDVADDLSIDLVRFDDRGDVEIIGNIEPDERGRARYVDADVEPGASYEYRLVASDGSAELVLGSARATAPEQRTTRTALHAPSPNPVRGSTSIAFEIADDERWGSTPTTLTIYDVSGRVVKRLVDGDMPSGRHQVSWDSRNEDGHRVASGCYLYALTAGSEHRTGQLVVLR